jgi:hypothetical protein
MSQTCEIRSGTNGVFDCQRPAIGAWQFDYASGAKLGAVKVCRWHANHFTRKGHWDVSKAFQVFSKQEVR